MVSILFFNISFNTIHFAKNPIDGGNPASLARIIINVHSLYFWNISFDVLFVSFIAIAAIIRARESQYKRMNVSKVEGLKVMAVIVHLMLKIDERARISMIFFLFSCDTLPNSAVIIIESVTMWDRRNVIKYTGAIFCSVISAIAGPHEDFFMIEMNHE